MATKTRKQAQAQAPAQTQAQAPAMPKAKRKQAPAAEPKQQAPKTKPETKTLAPAQVAAQENMIRLARAADSSFRDAAEAVAECAAMGIHRTLGMELAAYVTATLLGAGIARSTVYFLKDVGVATSAIGTEQAKALPMEALRELASKAKGNREEIRKTLGKVTGSGPGGKVTTDDVRKVTRGGNGGKPSTEAVVLLARKAMSYAGKDTRQAITLLEGAIVRVRKVLEKQAQQGKA